MAMRLNVRGGDVSGKESAASYRTLGHVLTLVFCLVLTSISAERHAAAQLAPALPNGFGNGGWDQTGYLYRLPYSPFTATCPGAGTTSCAGDLDHDGLLDAAEHELARVAAPSIVFDRNERHSTGLVLVYAAHPTTVQWSGCVPAYIEVLYRIVFLYPKDATHAGDSQSTKTWIASSDGGRTWRLVRAAWSQGKKKCGHCKLFCWRHRPNKWSHRYWDLFQDGLSALDAADWRRLGAGRHRRIFPSEGKHRLYRDLRTCRHTFHGLRWDVNRESGTSCESCGGGSEVLGVFGAPLRRRLNGSFAFDTPILKTLSPLQRIYQANLGETRRRLLEGRPYFHLGKDLGFRGENYDKKWCGGQPRSRRCADSVASKMLPHKKLLPLSCPASPIPDLRRHPPPRQNP